MTLVLLLLTCLSASGIEGPFCSPALVGPLQLPRWKVRVELLRVVRFWMGWVGISRRGGAAMLELPWTPPKGRGLRCQKGESLGKVF